MKYSTITAGNILQEVKQQFREADIPSYALDADLLLAHTLNITREQVIGYPERTLSNSEAAMFKTLAKRRLGREPMAHLLGKREFWGREFKVTKDTLDPRPDSETLINTVLSYYPNRNKPLRILDLGTGTGCLLLTLLHEFPYASGVGVDISRPALSVAKENCLQLGLEKRVRFLLQCWAEGMNDIFDIIISNPPYIKDSDTAVLSPEVVVHEPSLALFAGEDGLRCYRELMQDVARLLADDGVAVPTERPR